VVKKAAVVVASESAADEWQAWRTQLGEATFSGTRLDGMVVLEQLMFRSRDRKRCIECGDPGTVRQESVLIQSVSHYWMCADCDTYWKNKG
jgi:hypothetical protein